MTVDFDEVRAAVAAIVQPHHAETDPRLRQEILAARARSLAQGQQRQEMRQPLLDAVVVKRGSLRLGLDAKLVEGIRSVAVTPLPFATEVVRGLFQLRGTVECLVDVFPLLATGDPPEEGGDLTALVVWQQRMLGLHIDAVEGLRPIHTEDCAVALEHLAGGLVALTTRDLVHVLDVAALFDRPEILVNASA